MKTWLPRSQHQLRRRAHGGEIGADVDGVGDEQQRHEACHGPGRKDPAHVGRKPVPGDASDPGADHLHRGHQRVEEKHDPEHVDPELRARLRVGGYAAGIIVRCPGDQSRAQFLEQRSAAQRMDDGLHQNPGFGEGINPRSVRQVCGPFGVSLG